MAAERGAADRRARRRAEASAAVDAASRALASWSGTPCARRAEFLRDAADGMIADIEALARPGGSGGEDAIALINEDVPVVLVMPHDRVFQKTLSNLKEVESRGGGIVVVLGSRGR